MRDAAAIARFAAVTSPGDMIAPSETPRRRSSQFQMMPAYRRFAVTNQLHFVVDDDPVIGAVLQVPNVAIPADRGAAGCTSRVSQIAVGKRPGSKHPYCH